MVSVEWSLAWASPIRLSPRGITAPAARRRSRAAYLRAGADQASLALSHMRALPAHPARRYVSKNSAYWIEA